MATLARRMLRLLLFFGLFFLAVRFVHTYPIPMTQDQQQHLIVISEEMGVRDAEAPLHLHDVFHRPRGCYRCLLGDHEIFSICGETRQVGEQCCRRCFGPLRATPIAAQGIEDRHEMQEPGSHVRA